VCIARHRQIGAALGQRTDRVAQAIQQPDRLEDALARQHPLGAGLKIVAALIYVPARHLGRQQLRNRPLDREGNIRKITAGIGLQASRADLIQRRVDRRGLVRRDNAERDRRVEAGLLDRQVEGQQMLKLVLELRPENFAVKHRAGRFRHSSTERCVMIHC
jgi:hypothetical protein